jgi:hypothetical protein
MLSTIPPFLLRYLWPFAQLAVIWPSQLSGRPKEEVGTASPLFFGTRAATSQAGQKRKRVDPMEVWKRIKVLEEALGDYEDINGIDSAGETTTT